MKFRLGRVVITRGCKIHLEMHHINAMGYVLRHITGDWGDLGKEDKEANDFAVNKQLRIVSAYNLPTGERIYCVTEADRSITTLFLYDEY
jgi:hypothetical protein